VYGVSSSKMLCVQLIMLLVKLTHWILIMLLGLGLLASILAKKSALNHQDWIVDTSLNRIMEQVGGMHVEPEVCKRIRLRLA